MTHDTGKESSEAEAILGPMPPDGWLKEVSFDWRPGGRDAIDRWLREHTCLARDEDGELPTPTIGGRLLFVICVTGVGMIVDAECAFCKARLADITNLAENF